MFLVWMWNTESALFRGVEVLQHCDSAYTSHSAALWNALFLWVTFTLVYWDFKSPALPRLSGP